MRSLSALLGVAALALAVAPPAGRLTATPSSTGIPGGAADAAVRYDPPVPPPVRVLRPFVAPAGPYGPGHRGVDLAAAPGVPVRAAAAGTVTFAGSVAGRGVVVVAHADGIRTEYEPVRPRVRVGRPVAAAAVIGTVRGRHAGCRGSCLHWGARHGEVYLDPLLLLRPLGPVRLLPWDG